MLQDLARRGSGSTFGGGLQLMKPVDPSAGDGVSGFRATNPAAFSNSSFSRRNLLPENSNQSSNLSRFAPQTSAASDNERFVNRRSRLEGEEASELGQKNSEAENCDFSDVPRFPRNQGFSNNAGNVRMHHPLQAGKSPG